MAGMKAVVDDFYLLLPEQIQLSLRQQGGLCDPPGLTRLQNGLNQLRPRLTQQFTHAYPMHPELRASQLGSASANPTDPVDMERVDDWIRRTTIAQKVVESISPLPDEFNRHYSHLLNSTGKPVDHPFQPDAVLNVLADLIAPLKLDPNQRAFCYELMGQAFQKHAATLYQALLNIIGDAPSEAIHHPHQITSLEEWLKLSASDSAHGAAGGNTGTDAAAAAKISELAALLSRFTENLGDLGGLLPESASPHPATYLPANMLVPAMLARDRIFSRFLPATAGLFDAGGLLQGNLARVESGVDGSAVGQVLGGLRDLDNAALQGLYALMRQPPPLDPGPEKLAQASQVRALLLQAQGLLLEYTLNGLTYQAQPNHPAWALINALDALHQGADDRGQFLDPTLHHAVSLSMQWLLGQENVDAALDQVNRLLAKINTQLREDRQSRRVQHLENAWPAGFRPLPHPYRVVRRQAR